ncbi:MAG: hypothetical protein LUQ66_00415 [Methanoregula sp.]|nr:hypothetical protein [Methanoregula sp.]
MEDDDPFPRPITFDHLYAEEKPGYVAEPEPASFEEMQELARPIKMPPLTEDEEENPPALRFDAAPNLDLDDPAITDRTKRVDDIVNQKFLEDNKGRLLRPWDDVDLS